MSNPKNIKILSKEELDYLVEKYSFRMLNPTVLGVKTSSCARENIHSILESFTINTPIKRITITPMAINYWIKLGDKAHLIAVQNAINVLMITYQDISENAILKQIKKNSTQIIEK